MAFGDLVQSASSTSGSGVLTTPTLGAGATAGNLLVFAAARASTHSSGGAWPAVSGFTALDDSGINIGNMAGAWWYKVAAGSETTVSLSGETNQAGNWTASLLEFEAPTAGWATTPLDVKAENDANIASTTSTLSSGTTAATSVAESLALAFFAIDIGSSIGTESYTNSFGTAPKVTTGARAGHGTAKKVLSATGTQTTTITIGTADEIYGAIAVFAADAGAPPSVTLDTTDATTFTTATPTLLFTGTDADSDPIIYEIQIADNNDFNNATTVVDSWESASGTPITIHPQPQNSTTWNGQEAVDDRVLQSADTGGGGILDSVDLHINNDQVGTIGGDTFARIYTHSGTYGTSSAPADAAAYADTPTPGWLAESDHRTWDDTEANSNVWYQHDFSGTDRIQLPPDTKVVVGSDWDANSGSTTNTVAFLASSGGAHAGNAYIDGNTADNYGVQVTYDLDFRLRLIQTLYIDAASDADAGFANQDDGGDTSPFTSGDQVGYTVQGGDALANGTYYWRVRGSDGSSFGDWTTARSFTVNVTPGSATSVGWFGAGWW